MTSPLRKLDNQPHPDIAVTAFLQFRNFVVPQLITAERVEAWIEQSSILPSSDAKEAIQRGFAAAKEPIA